MISGVILTRQVRAEPQRFDPLGGTQRPTKTLTKLYKSDRAGSDQHISQQSAQMAAERAAFLVPIRQTGAGKG